ncbi:hypothetical protein GOTRE_181_00350 [Gordonia terrae NBRC 100016]|uniref:Uncharacterized protein n=1 Tax=Gordonia terrae NBRC 100016 TaxID=1089454 RepID=A0ABQ0HLJ7_9ACTN|nr:hypothetical protein BCM27_17675 [Gordonia terrae]GAB46755.1 hypothetical protein GOTRE_181_00350 [Gordonia terrae NBRC 100016]
MPKSEEVHRKNCFRWVGSWNAGYVDQRIPGPVEFIDGGVDAVAVAQIDGNVSRDVNDWCVAV